MNYYNDNDQKAAAWLRELIAAGHLPAGDVDTRSILDVRSADLLGYGQCHFFAGIGGWPLALRLADWPDDRPVWTGSCPCQPLSVAGKRKGHADERHLWPAFRGLVAVRRPAVVLGEQVASKDGREWLAAVRADLEALGYACGAADLCAAGVGAPHIRQRLYWGARRLADAAGGGRQHEQREEPAGILNAEITDARRGAEPRGHGAGAGGLADAERQRRQWRQGLSDRDIDDWQDAGWIENNDGFIRRGEAGDGSPRSDASDGFWSDPDWLFCRDGKWRPVESGSFPLDHGVPARVGRLRGYGNAIVPQVAADFIQAWLEVSA